MQCPICRQAPNWKNVDHYRTKPEGMALCQTCGFISYPDKYKSKAEIIAYYREAYRAPPNWGNVCTGVQKIQYHAHFLAEVLNQWKADKREGVLITDIGSATGMLLNWLRGELPGSEVYGVELTTSYVRNAWHEYKIRSYDDFDHSRKYDLICSYKSLEHILDPDVELKRYISSLKDDGYLYLSVPLWFEALSNFGAGGFSIEYYYSPNHVNTWTRQHVEGLIKACGGEIVKVNTTYYDTTWLIKRNDALLSDDRTTCYDDPLRITECLEKVHAANDAYEMGRFAEVLALWPNCPSAWVNHYEMNRKALDAEGFEFIYKEICLQAIDACHGDADAHYLAADICARYEQLDLSIQHLRTANQLRPNRPHVFVLLMNVYREKAKCASDVETKLKFLHQARQCAALLREFAPQTQGEATTWIMFDNSNIPTPFEVQG